MDYATVVTVHKYPGSGHDRDTQKEVPVSERFLFFTQYMIDSEDAAQRLVYY